MRPFTVASVLSLAIVAAGCGGGAKEVTAPPPQTVTQTTVPQGAPPTAKPKTTRGRYASGYPVSFGPAFETRCRKAGNGSSYCGCVVRYLKQHVPFSSVVAEAQKLATPDPPSWFVRAENDCFTP